MCGIAGFYIAPGDLGQMDTRAMTAVLALELQSRGRDATGVLTVDPKGRTKLRKRPSAADVFLASRNGIGTNAQAALIHTRMATQGTKENPLNNHPVTHGNIVGVHNGVVGNDDKLFEHFKWQRTAQVDSEAIFAALNYLPLDEALTQIDGSWAVGWVDLADDARKLWLARGWSSPLHYALTKAGSVVFASTRDAVIEAFEWGGVNGKPDPTYCKEGFLAHTNIEGGLTILPEFDGSGKTAIGAKTRTVYSGSNYHAGASKAWSGEGDYGSWYRTHGAGKPPVDTKDATPVVRYQVTGDKTSPKVGDRRRYIERMGGDWCYEICDSTSPVHWSALSGQTLARMQATDPPTGSLVSIGPPTEESMREWALKHQALPKAPTDGPRGADGKELKDEWDDENDEEIRLGFARVGDLIAIDKSHFGGNTFFEGGAIVGLVVDEDVSSRELIVEFRQARINVWADYEVLVTAQKGA